MDYRRVQDDAVLWKETQAAFAKLRAEFARCSALGTPAGYGVPMSVEARAVWQDLQANAAPSRMPPAT